MNKYSVVFSAFFAVLAIILSPEHLICGSFLISDDSVANIMYVGENITEIEEEFIPPSEAVPGESFVKSPKVRNTGNTPCSVRVRVDFSDSAAEALCDPLVICSGWTASEDGFLYWHDFLLPGEVTGPVFQFVRFRSDADGDELSEIFERGFSVYVYAESSAGGFG